MSTTSISIYFGHAYTGAPNEYLQDMIEVRRHLEERYHVLSFLAKGQVPPTETFESDAAMVRDCTIFVADATLPSTGLGVELMVAKEWAKPTLLISKKGSRPSKMALGIPNPNQEFFEYATVDALMEKINQFVNRHIPA